MPSIWGQLQGQIYLGDDSFVGRMVAIAEAAAAQAQAGRSRLEIPQAQRRARPKPLAAYEQEHPGQRNAAIQAAHASGGYTMAQLAAHFGLHYTSVSRIVKLIEKK